MSNHDNELSEIDTGSFKVRDVHISVKGVTPYSQSADHGEDKPKDESWDDFELRISFV